jgi:hypothetical protein
MGLVDKNGLSDAVNAYLGGAPDKEIAFFWTVVMTENWLKNEKIPQFSSGSRPRGNTS